MEIILFIIGVIIFILIGLYFTKEVDDIIIESKKDVLVIYDEEDEVSIKNTNADYVNVDDIDNIQDYKYYIINCQNDYLNLVMNYHIKKYDNLAKVYAYCHDDTYFNLYVKENINVIKNSSVKDLVERLYEENQAAF